jgi:hypothetical protein
MLFRHLRLELNEAVTHRAPWAHPAVAKVGAPRAGGESLLNEGLLLLATLVSVCHRQDDSIGL